MKKGFPALTPERFNLAHDAATPEERDDWEPDPPVDPDQDLPAPPEGRDGKRLIPGFVWQVFRELAFGDLAHVFWIVGAAFLCLWAIASR